MCSFKYSKCVHGKDLTRNCKRLTTQYMEDVSVSEMDVFSALHRLSRKLSRTLNKLPAYFLKRVAFPLLYMLTYLFNLTLSSGTLLTLWQCSIINPVYKKRLKK